MRPCQMTGDLAMRLFVRTLLLPLISALALVSLTLPASAAQQQNAYVYAHWNWAGGEIWNVDQNVWIRQKAPGHFWAGTWHFNGSSTGGYLGLQSSGQALVGDTTEIALF